jgi:hypothetical protein
MWTAALRDVSKDLLARCFAVMSGDVSIVSQYSAWPAGRLKQLKQSGRCVTSH